MKTAWKIAITGTALTAVLGTASALYAQTTTPSKPHTEGGMMMQGQQGDMMGMMNMMSQMSQMMDTCNKMMQGMDMGHQPQRQKQATPPAPQS